MVQTLGPPPLCGSCSLVLDIGLGGSLGDSAGDDIQFMCRFVIAKSAVQNKLTQLCVRKLIGKPVAATTPDCEFDARRIHVQWTCYESGLSALAASSKTFRIHSDLLFRDLAIAACNFFASGGVNLTVIETPLA